MARKAAIGVQSFEKVREGNFYYIDKTLFIKEWWESGPMGEEPERFNHGFVLGLLVFDGKEVLIG